VKALYLDGRRPLTVRLDGPALRVHAPEQADRLFPLQRLGRVIVSGQVAWATDALLACADRSVPISFLSREGRLRARLLGRPRARPVLPLGESLEALLEEQGPRRYRDWMTGHAQRARRSIAGWLRPQPWTVAAGPLRELVRAKALRLTTDRELQSVDIRLAGLMAAHLENLLAEVGLRPDAPALTVNGVALIRDLADILGWYLQPGKLRLLERRQQVAEQHGHRFAQVPRPTLTAYYERCTGFVETRFRNLASRLHAFNLEALEGRGD